MHGQIDTPERVDNRMEQTMPTKLFMVLFDDEAGICFPYGKADYCEGALDPGKAKPALFASRKAARRAISISKAHAKLLQAQGHTPIDDFQSCCSKCLKVVECEQATETA